MFTGIVQSTGVVQSVRCGSAGARLALDAPELPRPIPKGASICVSGACLTVVRSDHASIEFEVVPETLRRTTLGSLSAGDRVNLERSLRAGEAMDGHVVQGHVDGIADLGDIRRGAGGHLWTFSANDSLMPFIIPKGSIAIDGVSLTIVEVKAGTFSIALIPTTLAVTTLGSLRIGDRVNVETDILARTIVTTMRRWRDGADRQALTVDMLREQGFV